MISATTSISNKLGLHARAATKLAALAGNFSAQIKVSCNGKTIDAKSIMSLMLLAASKGTPIEVSADGRDEQTALDAVIELIDNKFDEGE